MFEINKNDYKCIKSSLKCSKKLEAKNLTLKMTIEVILDRK